MYFFQMAAPISGHAYRAILMTVVVGRLTFFFIFGLQT